jgi:hypothetical protein
VGDPRPEGDAVCGDGVTDWRDADGEADTDGDGEDDPDCDGDADCGDGDADCGDGEDDCGGGEPVALVGTGGGGSWVEDSWMIRLAMSSDNAHSSRIFIHVARMLNQPDRS